MAEHPNAQLVRDAYEAFSRGDMGQLSQVMASDIRWHEAGGARTPLAGDYKGQEAVFEMFGKLVELTAGQFHVTLIDCIADDHQAVAIHEVTARRGMHTYTSRETVVFHLLEGLVTDAWHTVPDLEAYEEFWAEDQGASNPNITRLREGYAAFATGDMAKLGEIISEDAVWHFHVGDISDGDYRGRDNIFAMFANQVQRSGGTLQMELEHVMADDRMAMAVVRGTATTNGIPMEGRQIHLYRVDDQYRTVEGWVTPLEAPLENSNITLARRGYEAFASGDLATLTELIAEDCTWRIGGRSPLAGEYVGRDAILALFARLAQETNGQLSLTPVCITCSGDRVMTLVDQTATRNGKTLTNQSVHVSTVRDGTLVDFCMYSPDTTTEDEFWM